MPSLTVSGNEITDAVRTAALSGDGLASPDSSFGILPSVTNLVPNGGFETNTTGWGTDGFANTLSLSVLSKFGTKALLVMDNGATGVITSSDPINITAGQAYTLSLRVRAPAGASNLSFKVTLRFGAFGSFNTTITLTNAHQLVTLTATAPVGSTTVQIKPQLVGATGVADGLIVDGVQLETGSIAHPYVETNGSSATRAASRVRLDTGLFDETQFAIAFRVAYGFASTTLPGSNPYLFDWRDDASNLLGLYLDVSTRKWTASRLAAASGGSAVSAAQTFAAQDETTVILACTATQVKVSVGGGAFVAAANTSIPTLAAALADLGSQAASTGWLDGRGKWATIFIGTLTDADAATLHALGSTDPTFTTLSSTAKPIAVIPFATVAYTTKTRQSYSLGVTCGLSVHKRPRLTRARTVSIAVSRQRRVRMTRAASTTVACTTHKRIRQASRGITVSCAVSVAKYVRFQPNKFAVDVSFMGGGVTARKRIRKHHPLAVAVAVAPFKRIRRRFTVGLPVGIALHRRMRLRRPLTFSSGVTARKAGHRTHVPTSSSTGRIRRGGSGGVS